MSRSDPFKVVDLMSGSRLEAVVSRSVVSRSSAEARVTSPLIATAPVAPAIVARLKNDRLEISSLRPIASVNLERLMTSSPRLVFGRVTRLQCGPVSRLIALPTLRRHEYGSNRQVDWIGQNLFVAGRFG